MCEDHLIPQISIPVNSFLLQNELFYKGACKIFEKLSKACKNQLVILWWDLTHSLGHTGPHYSQEEQVIMLCFIVMKIYPY